MEDSALEPFAVCESLVDRHYASLPMPGSTWEDAAWCLLSVCDDMQRFGLLGVSLKPSEDFERIGQAVAFQLLDDSKYALRHALALAQNLPAGRHVWHRVLDEEQHAVAGYTLRQAKDYAQVCRYFAGCHERAFSFSCVDGRRLEVFPRNEELRYAILETLLSVFSKPRTSFLSFFFNWAIRGVVPAAIREAVAGCRSKVGRVAYRTRIDAIREYAALASRDEALIPDKWHFPWGGSAKETVRILDALHAMALFHACVVHGAQFGTVTDHGASALCITLGQRSLCRHLTAVTGLNGQLVDELLRALSYGERLTFPDPALQPLVRFSGGAVVVAPLTLMGGDLQRNILSLHARYDRSSFDEQSWLFERQMTAALAAVLDRTPFAYLLNITLALGVHREEVDVVLIDDQHHVILLMELRWMLSPGDPREVSNRLSGSEQKVRQLERKLLRVRENKGDALKSVARDHSQGWAFAGILIIDGYAGFVPDEHALIHVIPLEVAKLSLGRFKSLPDWIAWLGTKAWIPAAGRDFVLEPWSCKFGSVVLEATRARLTINGSDFSSALLESMEACPRPA